MFSFFEPKMSGVEIGTNFLFRPLRDSYASGFRKSRNLFPTEPQISKESVVDEWLWFEVFAIDFSTYLALGNAPTNSTVLRPFWTSLKEWLQDLNVPALPERIAVAGGGLRTIPAEPSERAYDRLIRRMNEYSSTVPCPLVQGEDYSVAAVFASACGDFNAVTILGISVYFSSRKTEYVKFLRSRCITL